ncbi:hypothetical protein SteCoe_39195 [Stentor coeruleus]|uniref:Uncharacterized protein n=1 Tax=Stentor coeruleus TaxID=5963 RepID=A0A1R2AL17_9CILI|nr:hypothetical protein SteCoe_39195 [Stentor coeruleus]
MDFYFRIASERLIELKACFEQVINFILLTRSDFIDELDDQNLDNLSKIISEYPISDFEKPHEIYYGIDRHQVNKRISNCSPEDLCLILFDAVKLLRKKKLGNLPRQQNKLIKIIEDKKTNRKNMYTKSSLHNSEAMNSEEIDINPNLIRILREYLSHYNLTEENYLSCSDSEFYFRKDNLDYTIKFNIMPSSNHSVRACIPTQNLYEFKNLYSLLFLFSNCQYLTNDSHRSKFVKKFFDTLLLIRNEKITNNDLYTFYTEFAQVAKAQDVDIPNELTSLLRNLLLFLKAEKFSGYEKFILKTTLGGHTNEQSFLEYKTNNQIRIYEIKNIFKDFLKETANYLGGSNEHCIKKVASIDIYVFIYIETPMAIASISEISSLNLEKQNFKLIGIICGTKSIATEAYVMNRSGWIFYHNGIKSLYSKTTIDSPVILLYEKIK